MNSVLIEGNDEVYRLACMELRGGNHLAAYSAELPGLAGWVSCHFLRSLLGGEHEKVGFDRGPVGIGAD